AEEPEAIFDDASAEGCFEQVVRAIGGVDHIIANGAVQLVAARLRHGRDHAAVEAAVLGGDAAVENRRLRNRFVHDVVIHPDTVDEHEIAAIEYARREQHAFGDAASDRQSIDE